jgi:hypothetical protein
MKHLSEAMACDAFGERRFKWRDVWTSFEVGRPKRRSWNFFIGRARVRNLAFGGFPVLCDSRPCPTLRSNRKVPDTSSNSAEKIVCVPDRDANQEAESKTFTGECENPRASGIEAGYHSKSNRSLVYKKEPADCSSNVEQLRVLPSSNISIATPAIV